ncbi:MAG: GAF domain-containing protein [Candidatus Hydrogenedentes bacterium]|nr:GAF domain-containing protein [Candidatus Hydrogenedentota bacterium]
MKINDEKSWLAEVPLDEMQRIVDALYRLHRLHASITDLDGLLEALLEESQAVAHAEASSLLLYDPTLDELYFHMARGETGDQQALKEGLRLKLGEGIAGIAAETRASLNVADAHTDPRVDRTGDLLARFDTRSLLALPLLDNNELLGVLELVNKADGGPFTDFDQRVMEMFSSQAASAIGRARLIAENLQSERLAAVGQAVAGLSHYTKNIIHGMLGSVELVDEGMNEAKRELVDRGWPILKRSVSRLTHVVEDMLAFSKPREPLYEPCNVRQVLDEAAETFRELFERRDVALQVDVSGVDESDPPWLDARGLHQCILNLLTNAGDAVPEEDGKIRLSAKKTGDLLEIEVADNGPGISAENRHRIFDAFFSTKGSSGTGLGLAVTQKIVAEHGGSIEVSDSDLGGASFRLRMTVGKP